MKKFILVFTALTMVGSCAWSANNTNSFTDCLKDCSEYFSSQTVALPSLNLTTKRQIIGLDSNNKCQYKEIVTSQNSVYTVNCKFDKSQRTSLAKALEDFDKNPDNNNFDMSDFNMIKSTNVYAAWSKYLQDPDVCEIIAK